MKCLAVRALLAFILVSGVGRAVAQDAPAPGHLEAAREALSALGSEDDLMMTSGYVLAAMMETNPEISQFEDVIESWLTEVVNWEDVLTRVSVMYTESFTEAELREIAAFYNSPTGRKCVSELPELAERSDLMVQSQVLDMAPRLDEMIQERLAEPEAGKGE